MSPKLAKGQINQTLKAWGDLRAKKSYAEMSLVNFTAAVQPSLDTREEIDNLRHQLKEALMRRNAADATSCAHCMDVVRAVAGDKSEGPDSPFYKALGYVPASERKSGLARKKQPTLKAA